MQTLEFKRHHIVQKLKQRMNTEHVFLILMEPWLIPIMPITYHIKMQYNHLLHLTWKFNTTLTKDLIVLS